MKLDFQRNQTAEEVFGLNPRAANLVGMKPFKAWLYYSAWRRSRCVHLCRTVSATLDDVCCTSTNAGKVLQPTDAPRTSDSVLNQGLEGKSSFPVNQGGELSAAPRCWEGSFTPSQSSVHHTSLYRFKAQLRSNTSCSQWKYYEKLWSHPLYSIWTASHVWWSALPASQRQSGMFDWFCV